MFTAETIPAALLRALCLTPTALLWVLVLARVVGLRSFTKMTAFDFVATVATGSLLATAATSTTWPAYTQSMAGMIFLFATQYALALLRQRSDRFRRMVDNRPRVVMRNGRFDDEALRETRVTRSDVVSKLREANALKPAEVRVVVLEPTGDISVLHGGEVDELLLDEPEG